MTTIFMVDFSVLITVVSFFPDKLNRTTVMLLIRNQS